MIIINYILNLLFSPWALFIFIPLSLFLVGAVLSSWRRGIILLFGWLYFEDLVRRLIEGQPYGIMLLKEILIFLILTSFLGVVFFKNKKLCKPVFFGSFLVFGVWCLVEAFNPKTPNLFFALIGIRSYLWYVPFFWFGYYMFQDKKRLLKFCRILVYTSVFLVLFAIFQYQFFYLLSPSLMQPLATGHLIHYYWEGKIKLVPSVFASGERYARFSFFLFLLGLGLLFYPKNSFRQKILLFISTFSALLGIFVSGRRAPMYLSLIGVVLWLILYYRKELLKLFEFRANRSLAALLLIFAVAGGVVFLAFGDVADFFIGSFPSIIKRISLQKEEIIFAADFAGLFGTGLGTRTQGVHYIPGGEAWYLQEIAGKRMGIESGIGKVMAELGFIGLVLFVLWYWKMFLAWVEELKKLRGSEFYSLGISIFLFLILMLLWFSKGHQIFGDGTTLAFFWFFMGVLFRLPELSQNKKTIGSVTI